MDVHFTARKFKAHDSLKEHAIDSIKRLDKIYDGIVSGHIILSYERTTNSLKTAEINLHVHKATLTAKEKSEDYHKSIELAIEKIERQLGKYKTKLQTKKKAIVRKIKEKTTSAGEEE